MNTLKSAKILQSLAAGAGLVLSLALAPVPAMAHCDAVDGPVANAARAALDEENVNLVLPYVAADAEAELTAVFKKVLAVRAAGPNSKTLADRYFLETTVRLHRAGEGAPYSGLKPAGLDFGPAIPAAEKALDGGDVKPLLDLMAAEMTEGLKHRFTEARSHVVGRHPPVSRSDVPTAREGVEAEFDFIRYVEGIFLAIQDKGSEAHND